MEPADTTNPPKTRVSFRIFAPGLDPDDITKNLNLAPDHLHHEGDHISGNPKYTYKHGLWSIHSKLSEKEPLEAHLSGLLSILESKKSYIRTLANHTIVDFYCALFWQNGFQISPQILGRIGELGATFGVVIYPNDLDDQMSPNDTP